MNIRRILFFISFTIFFIVSLSSISTGQDFKNETEQERFERMEWWREARFGMFIHWGLYSLPARHEWVKMRERMTNEEYQEYFKRFNPDLYDPSEWAKAAKMAGMKYVVITSKHHEGFCLWDSDYTEYKSTNTPYGKDLLKPFVEAFRNEGIRVGFYYSLIDWHHSEFPIDRIHPMRDNEEMRKTNVNRDMEEYTQYMHNQIQELMTEFGQIDHFFPDFSYPGQDGKGHEDWKSEQLLEIVRKHQPQIIINDRLDLLNHKWGWDFRTPEQFMPRDWVTVDGERVPWETCQTFSGSWGYHRDEKTWKSDRQLIGMLIETVSKGGNLLLNVGPTARGTFDHRSMEKLKAIGGWMNHNSRSIYECTAAPKEFKKPNNCLLTFNPEKQRLYIHLLEWPMGQLQLEGYGKKVQYAQFLHDASEIQFTDPHGAWMSENKNIGESLLTLDLPMVKPETEIPVIELFLK